MTEIKNLMFLVTGPEPREQWNYTVLDQRDVYDRDGQLHTGRSGQIRESVEANARKWFKWLYPGIEIVSEEWREIPGSDEEWKELISV